MRETQGARFLTRVSLIPERVPAYDEFPYGIPFVRGLDSPILLTFPDADIVSFDQVPLRSVTLEETSHYRITRGILEAPERYWRRLLNDETASDSS